MPSLPQHLQKYVDAICKSGITIYDEIERGDPDLWIPTPILERIFQETLIGLDVSGLPLRTRSKVVKSEICKALGYPVPDSFKRTQPRFPGQYFDVYTQKRDNLQIWNEQIDPVRRYVILRPDEEDIISSVNVITGEQLALFDTTGILTTKYQARIKPEDTPAELISDDDTKNLKGCINDTIRSSFSFPPTSEPSATSLLPIEEIFNRLKDIVGETLEDPGIISERVRGGELHNIVNEHLGYDTHEDDGRFPDIRNQLLEVKLQTSPTIDLGLIRPDSKEQLDISRINDQPIRFCDTRYAVFYGETDGEVVSITHLYLTTGEDFFSRFEQFKGKVQNKKLQIPLPKDFFGS